MNLSALLFGFGGRINRGKWWLAVLIYVIFWIIVGIIAFAVMTAAPMAGIAVLLVAGIVAIVSGIAVGVKRLHDRDKSGWWLLAFYLVPALLNGVGAASGSEAVAMLTSLIAFAVSVWMIVELGCLRGTAGPNQYGPDPLEPAAAYA